MSEVEDLLRRQAAWQKSRKDLTWAEKVRLAEMVRESVERLRASAGPRKEDRTRP